MATPEIIAKLVERFERNKKAYLSTGYNEAQLREEFINPFFEALGWDVRNVSGKAEAYKDVIHEDAIKVGKSSKAPDYSFRIGGTRKFFVETKRPSVNIDKDVRPAYQIRRYSWSSKLPLAILTDFEELAVYDCRIKPKPTDPASVARILYIKYTEYLDRWSEIEDIFSKNAIEQGSFDKFIEEVKGKKGTSEVDDEFLKEIERWRELLAKNIALRNPTLSVHELNFVVQRTIDRIIFLRICEDRGSETYENLRELLDKDDIYGRLKRVYGDADDKYNSGLFHFKVEKNMKSPPDELSLSIKMDDKVLKDIIRRLYYPECPYEFSVFPIDILGNVYEQFLGKLIRLTPAHRAVVEEKPEVKKAGGVYYTPKYIVNYIVEKTLGKMIKGKSPKQISKLKILDPACGSGSFLIGAYSYLLDYHRDWYVSHRPNKHKEQIYQGKGGQCYLTTQEKKRILLNNIYGVDIDTQAVEVTKLNLLLKVMENENQDTLRAQKKLFQERILPDLGLNIKCGNSLISSDIYGGQVKLFNGQSDSDINAFDWAREFPEIMGNGGFDTVIGNPPYDVVEKERGKSSWPHNILQDYVKQNLSYQPALGGKLNLFRFFLVRSINLLNAKGRYGMIIPLAVLADKSCSSTRRYLLASSTNLMADCFPQKDNPRRRVFLKAKLSTTIITCSKKTGFSEKNSKIRLKIYPGNSFKDPFRENIVRFEEASILDPENIPIPLVDTLNWKICVKIYGQKRISRLGEVADFEVNRGEINQTIYRKFITDNPSMTRLLKGVEIGQFHIHEKLSQGHREWFDETNFLSQCPQKPIVKKKRIATQRITGVDERLRIVATLIEPTTYFADSTNSIVLSKEKSNYRLEYLLGLLNSKLFQWRFKITSTNNNVGTNELNSMPFRCIDFEDVEDKGLHNKMVSLVLRVSDLYKGLVKVHTPDEKTRANRQISAIKENIDKLVYKLYGITEEERKVIEESLR